MHINCQGIYINNNVFQYNAGCHYAFGNVIVSCEPNHQEAVKTNNKYTKDSSSNSGITATSLNTFYERYSLG